jgi:hypothetical protein
MIIRNTFLLLAALAVSIAPCCAQQVPSAWGGNGEYTDDSVYEVPYAGTELVGPDFYADMDQSPEKLFGLDKNGMWIWPDGTKIHCSYKVPKSGYDARVF